MRRFITKAFLADLMDIDGEVEGRSVSALLPIHYSYFQLGNFFVDVT